MNAADVLKYGHQTVQDTIADLPEAEWETAGVCGYWSSKDIISHLASYELLLVEVLGMFLDGGDTPTMKTFGEVGPAQFNDDQVALRKNHSFQAVLAEYTDAHAQVMKRIVQIPVDTLRQVGTIPWYGPTYSLDDMLVYAYYGHKREHSAQIAVFKDTLRQKA